LAGVVLYCRLVLAAFSEDSRIEPFVNLESVDTAVVLDEAIDVFLFRAGFVRELDTTSAWMLSWWRMN
jgi:hypothetical protein